jgi:hypothetical protein
LDTYYALVSWLIVAAIALTSRRVAETRPKRTWKALAMTWAFMGEFIWLAASYSHNLVGTFNIGLAIALVLLVMCKRLFQAPAFATLTANSLILFVVLLPVVDFVTRPVRIVDPHPEVAGNA